VLTAQHQPPQRALAEALGVDVFLTKPFSPMELLDTVERLLAKGPPNETA
jgi:CheY-like chemotaxis protein